MKKTHVALVCVVLVAALGVLFTFATTESVAEETGFLQILLVNDGEYTEVNYEMTVGELEVLFDGAVLASLLEGNRVRLSAESLDAASALVGVSGIDDIIAMYAAEETSWACIKCCYHPDCGCCDPDDPKDPSGD